MSKYVPKIIQELYQHKEYRGKTILIYNTKYDDKGNLTSYQVYKVYDGITPEANRDWRKIGSSYSTLEELEKNVFFEWVPDDLDSVEYL